MNGQLVAVFNGLNDLVNVAEIKTGVQALRVHIQRERDQINIASTLAIAEQTTFNPVAASQQTKFGSCNAAPSVVMRVQAYDDLIARTDVAAHPFDLVGIHVGHRCLNCCRQVQDQRLCSCWLQNVHDRLAHLKTEFEFRR